jgi:hypothetical protein
MQGRPTHRIGLDAGESAAHALQKVVPVTRVQRPDVCHWRHAILCLRDQVRQPLQDGGAPCQACKQSTSLTMPHAAGTFYGQGCRVQSFTFAAPFCKPSERAVSFALRA